MSFFKKYYKNLISLVVLIAGLTYLFINAEVHHLSQLDWRVGIALVLLHGIFYLFVTIPQLYILRKLNVPIGLGKIFSINIVTNFLNLLLPARGGVLIRGVIFNKNFNFKKRDYAALSVFISLVGIFVLGLMGMLFFPFMDWDGDKPLVLLEVGGFVLLLLGFFGLYSTKALAKFSPKIEELYNEKTQWRLINKKDNFFVTSLFYAGSLIAYGLRIFLLSQYFYLEIDLFDACALTVLLLLINTAPILPGNLGVKEASLSGILALMGYNAQIGFFIAIVDRLMQLIFLGILGVIFSFKWNVWSEWGKSQNSQE